MNGNNKLATIVFACVTVVAIILLCKFVIFKDYTEQDDYVETGSSKNEEPALTLKSDKQAEANIEEEKEDKKNDEKDKNEKKSNDKPSEKQLRDDAKNHALKTLEIQSKPKDEFKKDETQSLFESVATKKYVESHQNNKNKDDKIIKYKNVSLDIDKKELKKDTAKGTLKFDKLTNPKSKDSDIKPSTDVDSKMSIIFKKEDNTYKVDSTRS